MALFIFYQVLGSKTFLPWFFCDGVFWRKQKLCNSIGLRHAKSVKTIEAKPFDFMRVKSEYSSALFALALASLLTVFNSRFFFFSYLEIFVYKNWHLFPSEIKIFRNISTWIFFNFLFTNWRLSLAQHICYLN